MNNGPQCDHTVTDPDDTVGDVRDEDYRIGLLGGTRLIMRRSIAQLLQKVSRGRL
jgi:hypothetical protein